MPHGTATEFCRVNRQRLEGDRPETVPLAPEQRCHVPAPRAVRLGHVRDEVAEVGEVAVLEGVAPVEDDFGRCREQAHEQRGPGPALDRRHEERREQKARYRRRAVWGAAGTPPAHLSRQPAEHPLEYLPTWGSHGDQATFEPRAGAPRLLRRDLPVTLEARMSRPPES